MLLGYAFWLFLAPEKMLHQKDLVMSSRISKEYKERGTDEPLLRENPRRWGMFPPMYPHI